MRSSRFEAVCIAAIERFPGKLDANRNAKMIFVAEITCVGFMSCNETVNGPLLGTEKCGFIGESENSRGEKGGIFCNEKCNALRSFVAASAKQLWLHQP